MPKTRTPSSRPSSRCARRKARPTCSSSCLTMWALAPPVPLAVPCDTPNAEQLAQNGLSYNRFHTTALCSPTRQALLTGRNHHSVGMGGITEIATSAPAIPRCARRTRRPSPRRSSSTATRQRSSANATKSRSGKPARWDRSTSGQRAAAALSISTAFSAARPTSTIPPSTKERRRSKPTRRRKRAITSPRT